MTRRALFAALASLPFVGRFARKPVCDGFTDDTASLQALMPVVVGHCAWYLPRRPTFRLLEDGRMTMTF